MKGVNVTHAAFSAAVALHGLILTAGVRQAEPTREPVQRISVRLIESARQIPPTPVSRAEPPTPLPREVRKVEPPPPVPVPRPVAKAEKPLSQEHLEKPVQQAIPATEPAPAPAAAPPVEASPPPVAEGGKTPALLPRAEAPPAEPGRLADYLEMVRRSVELNKEYPSAARQLGQQGRVVVRTRIAPNGHLAEAAILTSSGHRHLDRAAVAAVRRSAPLKAPSGFGLKEVVLEIPIVFRLI